MLNATDKRTCSPVLSNVGGIEALQEDRSVVVDVPEVDEDVRVTHQALAPLVLSKHSELPLWSSLR